MALSCRYDYDVTDPPLPPSVPTGTALGSLWDVAKWDVGLWSAGTIRQVPSMSIVGATGEGHVVAVAISGYAVEPTTLVQVDVFYEEGGTW